MQCLKSHGQHNQLREEVYQLLMNRMQVDNQTQDKMHEQSVRSIEYLADKAEQMVFPIDRKQAISLITLVFNYLNEEWVNTGLSANLPYARNGMATNFFIAGAKRVYFIIRSNSHDFYTKKQFIA